MVKGLCCVGLLAWLLGGTSLMAQGVSFERDQVAGDERWSTLGAGLSSNVMAVAVSGGQIFVTGSFWNLSGDPSQELHAVACWNGAAWLPLGDGLLGTGYALAVDGAQLFVGGSFSQAGGNPANAIACWDMGTGTWSPLGSGVDGTVKALAISGRDLYVAGDFTTAGGVTVNHIARWNRDTHTWHALGSGLDAKAYALAVNGSQVFVGGNFSSAGGVTAWYVARWSSDTLSWSSLGSGVDGTVFALKVRVVQQGLLRYLQVYVGGSFTHAGSGTASNLAVWHTLSQSWSPVGDGTNGVVRALEVSGGDLYAGGGFGTAGGVAATRIARWNGFAWSPLGSGVVGTVDALADNGNTLLVGGGFSTAGGQAVGSIALWNYPPLLLNSPNGSEVWRRGQSRSIRWTAHGIAGTVTLELLRDGVLAGPIASGLDPEAGSFDWTVGLLESGDWVTGNNLSIRVRSESGETLCEQRL